MKLHVANLTKQHITAHYRVPENPKLLHMQIPIGHQVRIYKDEINQIEADAIIAQLVKGFGAVDAREVDRTKRFVGVTYSLEKPVKDELIERGVEGNVEVLTVRGIEQRKASAIAGDALVGSQGGSHYEMEIVEEAKRGDESPKFAEAIVVEKPGQRAARRQKAR